MFSTLSFPPAVVLRTFCMACALALAACGSDAAPEPDNEKSDEDPSSQDEKDASTKKPDAGKTSAAKDASVVSDPNQIKPKDAGKPPIKDPEPVVDAGTTTPPPKPDGGSSTPVTPSADAGTSASGIPAADLDMLRTVCVDEINKYRATLMLPPLARPTPQHESCSDEGAKIDGDSKQAHGWAKAGYKCTGSTRGFPGFYAQNTCPGWPASSVAALATALQGCLKQMWAEGEPPEGEQKCKADFQAGQTACFLAHGHYLNMKSPFKSVSCGFYNMGKSTYWMNQDFL